MTASSGQKPIQVRLSQNQVLLGGGVVFLLGGYFLVSSWFDWASFFRAHPLLGIPCTFSLIAAPALLYVSVRSMTEVGVRLRLLASTLLSAAAIGLIAAALHLWLRNAAGL